MKKKRFQCSTLQSLPPAGVVTNFENSVPIFQSNMNRKKSCGSPPLSVRMTLGKVLPWFEGFGVILALGLHLAEVVIPYIHECSPCLLPSSRSDEKL